MKFPRPNMAPLLFREIKGINFSCSSPSSAATCSSIHQRSIIQPVSTGREIDRHTPRLSDPQRIITRQPQLISNTKPRTRKSSAEQADLVNPADSSRCLLGSTRLRLEDAPAFYDIFPDSRTIAPPLLSTETSRFQHIGSSELAVLRPSASTRAQDQARMLQLNLIDYFVLLRLLLSNWLTLSFHLQVVDLRVSLHCKGCEGKVRRHIAKMQGEIIN